MIMDASSLVILIMEGDVEKAFDNSVLDLTFYEADNVFWKKKVLQESISSEELEDAMELLDLLKEELEVLEPEIKKTMKLAEQKEVAFYDASYLAAARKKDEKLVTEDSKLRSKAGEKVQTLDAQKLVQD